MMGLFSGNTEEIKYLLGEVLVLRERIEKLEKDARYIADQPKVHQDGGFLAWQMAQQAYQNGILMNEVPINEVVKAIVKHLGMEIEKVPEQTTKKPQEVNVVEKQPSVTITGMEGTTAVWTNPAPPPKKRGRPVGTKNKRKTR